MLLYIAHHQDDSGAYSHYFFGVLVPNPSPNENLRGVKILERCFDKGKGKAVWDKMVAQI